jgi:hypothetical protein
LAAERQILNNILIDKSLIYFASSSRLPRQTCPIDAAFDYCAA